MSNPRMPIRRYLQGEFNAAVNESGDGPLEAYTRLERHLGVRALDYDTYAQATITSGGHARNPNLGWPEIVAKNVTYAQNMAEVLYQTGELDPAMTIEAATLGLINHWKESDYITFWLHTLARPQVIGRGSASGVKILEKNLRTELDRRAIDLAVFNDYAKSAPERSPLYFQLADAYVDALADTEHSPVRRLVAVSETKGSLGASTERYFAKKLGTKVYGLAAAQLGMTSLPAGYPHSLLVRDTAEIVEYGGQVFDPRRETRIILVEQ